MQLRLVLLRHGEAENAIGREEVDHARRLTPRGEAQARAAGRGLTARGWVPDAGIGSDAARAAATARLAFPDVAWRLERGLYLTALDAIADVAGELDAGVCRTLVVVGHNPGFSEAAALLGGRPVALGTAHAALLEIEAAAWGEALRREGEWRLVGVVTPDAL